METVIKLEGDLTASKSNAFAESVIKQVPTASYGVVLDFAEASVIDSAGIGALVRIHAELVKSGTELRIRNLNSDIFQMFRLMHLDKHFQIE